MDLTKSRYSRFRHLIGDGVTTGEVFWSAVFAGAIVTLVGQVMWSLLGVGIGITAVRGEPSADAETIAWAAYAYWAVTGITSAAAGGWTAGWVAGTAPRVDRLEGGFQGFLSWAVATLGLTLVVLGLAGGPLGMSSLVAGPLSVAAGTAEAATWGFVALVLGALASAGAAYLAVGFAKLPVEDAANRGSASGVVRPAE
jgi:hypothetical protein